MYDWINNNILSLVIFLPLLGAVGLLCLPKQKTQWIKMVALVASLIAFVFSLHLVYHFQDVSYLQFEKYLPWIPSLNIQYHVGIDGMSLWLVLLTTFLMPIAILFSTGSIREKQKTFYFNLLILETGMLGALCALDGFLFYIFWEAMLIPMYFLIGIFGHGRRVYSALKFFLYTMVGSVLMLLAMIFLYYQAGESFSLIMWLRLDLPLQWQLILFLAFALSFAIKVPLFPLHTWLPDAHTEAPTAGSVILAGVLLKMGTYGFVRFAIPLFPNAVLMARPYIAALAVFGIIYGALVALAQKDMKRLVAYSSISHLGFVMLGLMALTPEAVTGAVFQMVNHGLTSAGLFLLVGMFYDRTHTRLIADYGGVAKQVPMMAFVFIVITLGSIAIPGTSSFVGEFLILSGSFAEMPILTVIATLGVILGAVYMLWLVERVFFGPIKNESLKKLSDLNWREALCMIPMMVLIVWMGLKPNYFLEKINLGSEKLTYELFMKQKTSQHTSLSDANY